MRLHINPFQKQPEGYVPQWLKGVDLPPFRMTKIAGVSDARDLQLERPSDVSALRSSFQYIGDSRGAVPNGTIDRLAINHMGSFLLEEAAAMGVLSPHVSYYKLASRQDGGSNMVIEADYQMRFQDEAGVYHTAIVRVAMHPETGEIIPPSYLTTSAGQRLPFEPDTFDRMAAPRYRGPSVYLPREHFTYRPDDLDRVLFASTEPRKMNRTARRWGTFEGDPVFAEDGDLVWYDLDPAAAELWVVEGPSGYAVENLDPDNLPSGFRWIDEDEWAKRRETKTVISSRFASIQPGHGSWDDLLENVPHDVGNITRSPEHDPDVNRGDLVTQPDAFPDYGELDMDEEDQVEVIFGRPRTRTIRFPYAEE